MIARACAVALVACVGCKKDRPRIVADEATVPDARADGGDAAAVPTEGAAGSARFLSGDCLDTKERLAHLEHAWLDGDRVVLCLGPDPEQESTKSLARECFFVDPIAGEIRRAPTKPRPVTSTTMKRIPYASQSADGKLAMILWGGARVPHEASATLIDAKTKKAIKSDDVPYDEHLELEGWIGGGIVLRTWVDEGPGCVHVLIDPTKVWPPSPLSGKTLGASCYALDEAWPLSRDRVVFVDGAGGGLSFVDAATLDVRELRLDHFSTIDEPNLAPLNADGARPKLGLLLVYGSPRAGDVVEVDLEKETVARDWVPKICKS